MGRSQMKKRVIVSFIVTDDNESEEALSIETKKLIGNTLKDKGFTKIVIIPGLNEDTGQEFILNFPPIQLDTSTYNDWE